MIPKAILQMLSGAANAASQIRRPLALVALVVLLSFALCFLLIEKVDSKWAPLMIGILLLASVGLSALIILISLGEKTGSSANADQSALNALFDDLGHKIYMSVTMYFSNFASIEERIEAYKTLVTSITIGGDEHDGPLRDRMAKKIREDAKSFEKIDV